MRYFFYLLALGFTSLSFTAQAWTIEQFDLKADIQADGSVNITETITADFSDNRTKHGIIRDIPYRYTDENEKPFKTPLTNISVTNKAGTARKFTQSQAQSDLSLKIGDANKYVKAQEVYVINYTVTGVINAFDQHDEFYWNVTGDEWDVSIEKASALVSLPESSTQLKAECYTGQMGVTDQDCEYQLSQNKNAAGFKTTKRLKPAQGLTLVFGWEKGLINIPERVHQFDFVGWAKKLQYLFLALPLFLLYKITSLRQKVADHSPIIPLYHPPEDLSLGQTLHLYRGKTVPKDLTAVITQLGALGALTIKEEPHDSVFIKNKYVLTPLGKDGKNLSPEAVYAYDHLFFNSPDKPVTLREIAKSQQAIFAYGRYEAFKKLVHTGLGKYFRKAQTDLKIVLRGLLAMFIYIPVLIMITGLSKSPLPFICSGLAVVLLFFFPKRSKVGNQKLNEIKGYREFLATAETQKINWSEAQNIFEKNLPYAVGFGLTEKWAQVFKDKVKVPDWYQNQEGTTNFKRLDQGINKVAGSAIASATRAHHRSVSASRGSSGFGGGRSGGGFGGGGGRSW